MQIDIKCLPEDFYQRVKNYDPGHLSMFLQLGYYSFLESKINVNTKPIQSVREIGAIGEDYVESVIQNCYQVNNVSKQSLSGDLLVKKAGSNIEILVEVKNYNSKIVPQMEVDKFYRDLEVNNHVRAGLFISLGAKISGIEKTLHYTEFTCSSVSKPVIFLVSNIPEIIQLCLDLLYSQVEDKDRCDLQAASIKNNRTQILCKINKIAELLDNLSKARNQINNFRSYSHETINKITELINITELQIRSTIEKIYKHLPDPTETASEIQCIEIDLQTNIKNKYQQTMLGEKNMELTILTLIKSIIGEKTGLKMTTGTKIVISQNQSGDESTPLIQINPYKTKVILGFPVAGEYVKIPKNAKYEDGWITFILDKNYMRNNICNNILEFINCKN